MKEFLKLVRILDETKKTSEKIDLLQDYFKTTGETDLAYALALISGKKLGKRPPSRLFKEAFFARTNLSEWIFEESYSVVGDLAETLTHLLDTQGLLPDETDCPLSLSDFTQKSLQCFANGDKADQQRWIHQCWEYFDDRDLWIAHKIWMGNFRIGLSQKLLIKALAQFSGISEQDLQHRLMGNWEVSEEFISKLLSEDEQEIAPSRPYPFFLASPIEDRKEDEFDFSQWSFEWKWDGIRVQVVKREGQVFLWSRGEEIINRSFPDLVERFEALPDGTVLDGELLPGSFEKILSFSDLQQRLGRKAPTPKFCQSSPVFVLFYDVLEYEGQDYRSVELNQRREKLEHLHQIYSNLIEIGPIFTFSSWEEAQKEREKSRALGAEGFMVKRKQSAYGVGRKRGDWWKWKVDPLVFDGVLLYAQSGHGRRADLFTDYTLAVWSGEQLVPVAKAYSGLTDKELVEMDKWIKRNTREKFGPVRSVTPFHVFEIAFENIQKSSRHKSGLAMRFPRIKRWRKDKPAAEASRIEELQSLLESLRR